jgi:hypothetical protein
MLLIYIFIFSLQYIATYKIPFKTYLLFSQNIKKIEDNELSKCAANITNLEINKFLQNIQKKEIKEIPEIWDDGEVEWEL